jgi:rubrerythrin
MKRGVQTMSAFKTVVDVLEVAVRIERLSVEFYRRLYDTSGPPQARSAFSFLAAEEEKHIGIFRTMLDRIADYPPRYEYPGEYGQFLSEYAGRFMAKAEKASSAMNAGTISEAIDAGIEFEKETILFYLELKSEQALGEGNDMLLTDIINEERAHWKKLQSLKGTLTF